MAIHQLTATWQMICGEAAFINVVLSKHCYPDRHVASTAVNDMSMPGEFGLHFKRIRM